MLEDYTEIESEAGDVGVIGKAVVSRYELADSDRIEIDRPLSADPKEIRRQRAEMGLKTKKGGGD